MKSNVGKLLCSDGHKCKFINIPYRIMDVRGYGRHFFFKLGNTTSLNTDRNSTAKPSDG
jgi:hypothetical protein